MRSGDPVPHTVVSQMETLADQLSEQNGALGKHISKLEITLRKQQDEVQSWEAQRVAASYSAALRPPARRCGHSAIYVEMY